MVVPKLMKRPVQNQVEVGLSVMMMLVVQGLAAEAVEVAAEVVKAVAEILKVIKSMEAEEAVYHWSLLPDPVELINLL